MYILEITPLNYWGGKGHANDEGILIFHFRGRGCLTKMVITFHFPATLNFIYGP